MVKLADTLIYLCTKIHLLVYNGAMQSNVEKKGPYVSRAMAWGTAAGEDITYPVTD